jgi:hypothetical protein
MNIGLIDCSSISSDDISPGNPQLSLNPLKSIPSIIQVDGVKDQTGPFNLHLADASLSRKDRAYRSKRPQVDSHSRTTDLGMPPE